LPPLISRAKLAIMRRSRILYSLLILIVVLLGLGTRQIPQLWPHFVVLYGGDTLWALCVFLGLGWLCPRATPERNALIAFAFSLAIELSQLYHAPWLDALRANPIGGLVLGYGFLWSDLVCYAVGIAAGWLVERLIFNKASCN